MANVKVMIAQGQGGINLVMAHTFTFIRNNYPYVGNKKRVKVEYTLTPDNKIMAQGNLKAKHIEMLQDETRGMIYTFSQPEYKGIDVY